MEKVETFCRQHDLLPKGVGILVACSGGPDSLALLMLLWQLRGRYRLRVAAAHFEHGIRGAESKEDAAFVQSFCQQHGIPFRMGSGDVPAYAAETGSRWKRRPGSLGMRSWKMPGGNCRWIF